jgi:hypothetical protein
MESPGPPVFVIVTVDVDDGQGALLIVHMNTFAPTPRPVTVDVGDPGVVMVPVPLTSVQVPVPTVGAFPASVAEVLHKLWFAPAFAVVGGATPVIVTVDVEGVHGGLLMVQVNTFAPTPKPVTPEVGDEGVVIVPVPLVSVQVPVPTVGVFPANVAVLPQTVCAGPAFAVVGPPVLKIVTVSVDAVHGGLEMVHMNTFAPAPRPVMVVDDDPGVVMVPAPLTSVQVPVPITGVFAAIVTVVLQPDCPGPALATVGAAFLVIITVSVVEEHGGLLIVQTNTVEPTPSPVTPDVGDEGVVTDPVPLTTVQVPVPTVGVFPASVAVVAQTT